MPNLKIYADAALHSSLSTPLKDSFPALAALLMDRLNVGRGAVQLAVVWVDAPNDQPALNIELSIMPGAERTREKLTTLAQELRLCCQNACGQVGAVRISQLDAQTFVSLK